MAVRLPGALEKIERGEVTGGSTVTVTCVVTVPGDLVAAADSDFGQRLATELRATADLFFDEERRRREKPSPLEAFADELGEVVDDDDDMRALNLRRQLPGLDLSPDLAHALDQALGRFAAALGRLVDLHRQLGEDTASAAPTVAPYLSTDHEALERSRAQLRQMAERAAEGGARAAEAKDQGRVIWEAFRRGDPFALQNMFIPITPGDLLRLWRDEAFLVALSAALEAGDDPAAATRQLIAEHLAPTEQAPPTRHWGLPFSESPAANLRALDLAIRPIVVTELAPDAPTEAPDAPTEAPGDAERALLEAIQDRVAAALLSGRRVNVVELGRRERAAAPLAEDSTLTLTIAADEAGVGRQVTLRVRLVEAESAISVYYDPDTP